MIEQIIDPEEVQKAPEAWRLIGAEILSRQSMARWLGLAADWLRPIYEEIRTGVMAGELAVLGRCQGRLPQRHPLHHY